MPICGQQIFFLFPIEKKIQVFFFNDFVLSAFNESIQNDIGLIGRPIRNRQIILIKIKDFSIPVLLIFIQCVEMLVNVLQLFCCKKI